MSGQRRWTPSGEGPPRGPQKCPYCDFTAVDTHAEINHMTSEHRDVLRSRHLEFDERYVGGATGIIHRDREREPVLLIRAPITPTREEAIQMVQDTLTPDLGPAAHRMAVAIIDQLTRVREP